jgi:Peptidase family M23
MRRRSASTRWAALVGVALAVVSCLCGAARSEAAQTTALAVQVGAPARAVHGSDGREHVDYDLVISNAFTVPARLDALRVFGDGRPVLTLKGRRLADQTLTLADAPSKGTVPVSSTVKTLVDVALPRSFGRRAPRRLTERLRYAVAPDAPGRTIIASTVVRGPTVRVDRRPPVRIASPLYGPGWLDSSGCCDDPTSEHRTLLLPADGSFRTAEMFAIDWIRETRGSFYTGDGSKVTDWPGFGAPIHAVANGIVVRAINDRPEVPPFTSTADNPTLHGPGDYGGNGVVERIAPGRYAVYLHLQTGSVDVKVGQRIRTGRVLGLLGNTGNTTGPHLHFGIQNGPNILTSDSVPFEIGSFTVQGKGELGEKAGTIRVVGPPRRATLSEPLIRSVYKFSP